MWLAGPLRCPLRVLVACGIVSTCLVVVPLLPSERQISPTDPDELSLPGMKDLWSTCARQLFFYIYIFHLLAKYDQFWSWRAWGVLPGSKGRKEENYHPLQRSRSPKTSVNPKGSVNLTSTSAVGTHSGDSSRIPVSMRHLFLQSLRG